MIPTSSRLFIGAICISALSLTGCGKKADAPAATPPAAKEAKEAKEAKPAEAATAPKADEKAAAAVTVAAKGTNFDPPIEIATLPKDAWYCDMGKSHFARMEKGDATCPRCKMALKHK